MATPTTSPSTSSRGAILVSLLILAVALPARVALMNRSLWLDEAWVANSIHEPSWRGMFFFDRFVQTSPPLYLALSRVFTAILGSREWCFRAAAWLGASGSVVLASLAFRRLFNLPLTAVGAAIVALDYWSVKYAQQAKQYGTDMFASALLLWLLIRFLQRERSRRDLALLCAAAALCVFLSFPAVFWFPSIVLAALLPLRLRLSRRAAISAASLGASLAILYFVFVRPNSIGVLASSWEKLNGYLQPAHSFASARDLFLAFAELLVPRAFPASGLLAFPLAALAGVGFFRALAPSRGNTTALAALLGGAGPLATAIVLSFLHQYPLLAYPRVLLWSLPSLGLLILYAVEPAARRIGARFGPRGVLYATMSACLLAALFVDLFVVPRPTPTEENRQAIEFIRSRIDPSGVLYVHGGMSQQFEYYQWQIPWSPAHLYIGNTDWPCCFLHQDRVASDPRAADFAADLGEAAARVQRGSSLWLLLPAGSAGHWSGGIANRLASIPSVMAAHACRPDRMRYFGQTLVESFVCP